MILVDANILVYAIDSDSPHHARARAWIESALSGAEWVGLPWISVLAFLRVTTNQRVVRRPLAVGDAIAYVDGWLRQPYARLVGPGENHWPVLRNLLSASGAAGNLTSDAHLAALAMEHGAAIVSADNDFKRFSGVHHVNPLAA